ncbi:MAG: hypothetical protein ABJN69_05775 [Hellea sp.]
MTSLLIFSCLCVAIGGAMVFWHQAKTKTSEPTATNGEDGFSGEMLAALKELYPDVPFEYIQPQDMIEPIEAYDGELKYKFFLGNLRNRARDMGQKDRHDYIREMILTFTDRSEITDEELKSALYLRARTPSELHLRDILLDDLDRKDGTIAAMQRGDILLETVMDINNGVRVMDAETLKEHGLDLEEAFNLAATNLLRSTPDTTEALWEKVSKNIWISKLNDDYDAARMFTFPEHMHLPFKGQATAYAPAHAILLITDKREEETLDRMVKFGNDAAETQRLLSNALWGQTIDGWERLTSTNRSSIIWQAGFADDNMAYAEQKNLLEQVFEKKEKDIFVASVMAAQEDGGDIYTMAVFIGAHGYLPIVDYVVLTLENPPEDRDSLKLPWSRFVDIMGPDRLKAVPGLLPKRLVFEGELPEAVKQQLIAAAAPL